MRIMKLSNIIVNLIICIFSLSSVNLVIADPPGGASSCSGCIYDGCGNGWELCYNGETVCPGEALAGVELDYNINYFTLTKCATGSIALGGEWNPNVSAPTPANDSYEQVNLRMFTGCSHPTNNFVTFPMTIKVAGDALQCDPPELPDPHCDLIDICEDNGTDSIRYLGTLQITYGYNVDATNAVGKGSDLTVTNTVTYGTTSSGELSGAFQGLGAKLGFSVSTQSSESVEYECAGEKCYWLKAFTFQKVICATFDGTRTQFQGHGENGCNSQFETSSGPYTDFLEINTDDITHLCCYSAYGNDWPSTGDFSCPGFACNTNLEYDP